MCLQRIANTLPNSAKRRQPVFKYEKRALGSLRATMRIKLYRENRMTLCFTIIVEV